MLIGEGNATTTTTTTQRIAEVNVTLSRVVGGVVMVSILLVTVYLLCTLTRDDTDDADSNLSTANRAFDNTMQRLRLHLEALTKETEKLQKEIQEGKFKRNNCTSCDANFVTYAEFDSDVDGLESELDAVQNETQGRLDAIVKELEGFAISRNQSLNNCTDCLPRTTFEAFQFEVESQVLELASYTLLGPQNYARTDGSFGPPTPGGNISDFWIVPVSMDCEGGYPDPTEQTQSVSLGFRQVTTPGVCIVDGTELRPQMFKKPNGVLTFCPCEDGWYMVGVTVENLGLFRSTPDLEEGTYPAETGGSVSFGLVYSPEGSEDPLFFRQGPWPLSPVISFAAKSLNTTLATLKTERLRDFDIEFAAPVLLISQSNSRGLFLKANVPGENPGSCYDLVMNVNDPFVAPEFLCNTAGANATIDYTFYYPNNLFVPSTSPAFPLRFLASLTVQRLAWKGDLEPDYYNR